MLTADVFRNVTRYGHEPLIYGGGTGDRTSGPCRVKAFTGDGHGPCSRREGYAATSTKIHARGKSGR
jgi:hypothetical protein